MKTIIIWITTMIFGVLSYAKSKNETRTTRRSTAIEIQAQFSTNEIVAGYLSIKNALLKSDSKATAQAAKGLEAILTTNDTSQLSAAQKLTVKSLLGDVKKQTRIISANGGKLEKQRLAFQQMSKSIYDLVTTFGSTKKLYVDFCPMYEEGSIWLSESKTIRNPYYGAQMLTCGSIKETIE